jgi:hypothetical protein
MNGGEMLATCPAWTGRPKGGEMHRQKFNVRKPHTSLESLHNRRSAGLYCRQCQQPVKRRQAVHAGSRRSLCPVCGEVLELRPDNGEGQPKDGNGEASR